VVENRYLFIFGGFGKTGYLNDLLVYDTGINLASMIYLFCKKQEKQYIKLYQC
jgi:hypothetical protein